MIKNLDQFSLTARLRMIAGASIILMLTYVGANFLMGTVSQRVDDRATRATENLVAASGLEKGLHMQLTFKLPFKPFRSSLS